jgi:hypothetical protein
MSRSYIGSQLHDLLALVQPADAIDLAIGSLCEHCFNLLEALKQCGLQGADDGGAVPLARSAALVAVDDLERALQSANPSVQAVAWGRGWPAPSSALPDDATPSGYATRIPEN